MPACISLPTVRRAAEDDLDQLAMVWHQSAMVMDGAAPSTPSRQELRHRIDKELAAGWELFLAERDGRIVGLLALRPLDAILDQLFVLPEQQASGIGTALLEKAKQRMPNGFDLRMAAANQRAATFYERSGLHLAGMGFHPSSGAPVRYYRWTPGR